MSTSAPGGRALLAIDVGNTQTVVGVYAELAPTARARIERAADGLVAHWRLTTAADRTADEWALSLSQLLRAAGFGLGPDEGLVGAAISSSVPSVTASLRTMFAAFPTTPCVIVEPGVKTGMPILYENPREVGADRIVNAAGALDLFDPPIVVVDLGTATTFDAISAAGEYVGGAIVPGVEISTDALFAHAAALRRVELVAPRRVIGRTTVESVQSGVVFGYAALVDGLVGRFVRELGPSTVVATGGLGGVIVPHAASIAHHEPWLTLHGLRLLFARNGPSAEHA